MNSEKQGQIKELLKKKSFRIQAYAGGGWECVKVTQSYPLTVEYMNDAEKAMYEEKQY